MIILHRSKVENLDKNMFNFIDTIVPADYLWHFQANWWQGRIQWNVDQILQYRLLWTVFYAFFSKRIVCKHAKLWFKQMSRLNIAHTAHKNPHTISTLFSLRWCHNGRDGGSNDQPHDSTFYSGADQSKHQSSASLASVWGIHRGPVNSPYKWPVTWKIFPFDDVIMYFAFVTSPFYPCPSRLYP